MINASSVVRLKMLCSNSVKRCDICMENPAGTSFSETCCGVILITAVDWKVSLQKKATTVEITSPANIGPMIQDR